MFNRITTSADSIEQFGILEMNLSLGAEASDTLTASMEVENQSLAGLIDGDEIKFMFSPKAVKKYSYKITSNNTSLDGKTGCITSYLPPEENRLHPNPNLPNWLTDNPLRDVTEGQHIGAKTVSQWRKEFLDDFKERMDRCKSPAKY